MTELKTLLAEIKALILSLQNDIRVLETSEKMLNIASNHDSYDNLVMSDVNNLKWWLIGYKECKKNHEVK